jgi:hypothetical protein
MLRVTWRRLAARDWRLRWMTPAVSALLLGGCASSPGLLSTPSRLVHAAGSAGAAGASTVGGSHWCYSRDLDDCRTSTAARRAAKRELKIIHRACGGRGITKDYVGGFEQAFVDVALGGDGAVPAYPPRPYWELWHRTPQGHAAAQHWFDGYAAGAQRAWGYFGDFNVVPTTAGEICEAPYAECGN